MQTMGNVRSGRKVVVDVEAWDCFKGYVGPIEYYHSKTGELLFRRPGTRFVGKLEAVVENTGRVRQWILLWTPGVWQPREQRNERVKTCGRDWHVGMGVECIAYVFDGSSKSGWRKKTRQFYQKYEPQCSNPAMLDDLIQLATDYGLTVVVQGREGRAAVGV